MPRPLPSSKDVLNGLAASVFGRLGYSGRRAKDAKREAWWWLRARAQAVSRGTRLVSSKAVVFTAPGVAELLPVEVPSARSGEVTVEIVTSIVSPGTERAFYLHLPNTTPSYPFFPGYSASGVVLATRGDTPGVTRGDRVAVRGVGHASVATATIDAVHSVPDGVALEEAGFVQIGVICGHGVRRAAIEPGEEVVVVGAGLIGLLTGRLALVAGASSVVMVARSKAKERAALAGGASRLLAADDDEKVAALAAPVVIEATGDAGALRTAILAAGADGRVVLLGSSRGLTRHVPVDEIRAKRLRVIGAHVRTLDAESREASENLAVHEASTFLDHLDARRLRLDDLVDEVIDPREADAFYRRLASARDIVSARYDWTRLPEAERARRSSLLRAPSLSGAGVDATRPLRTRRSRSSSDDMEPTQTVTSPLRIGLLGCGDIAALNAAAIVAAPNTVLVACFDPVEALAEDIASMCGAATCRTSDALLSRSDVDAALICVPHHLHHELGEKAASAGKHVIVEKPLANDLASARALVDAAGRADVTLSVCFPHRYDPDVVEARKLISEGAVGFVEGMRLAFSTDKPPSYWSGGFSGRAQSGWRTSKEMAGGGVLIMNLSHYIDLLRHLTKLDAETVAAHTHARDPSSEIEDTITVTARYENGAVGSILGAAAARGTSSETELRIWGADGHVAIEPKPLVYTQRAVRGLRTGRWQSYGSKQRIDIRAEYFRRLARAVRAGEEPEVSGRDGLAVQAFIEAAYQAAETGANVAVQALLAERA